MIGKKIKARRIELGLTQEQLAARLGYKSKSTINKIELDINDVSQSKLIRLADALGVDPTYFIDVDYPSERDERLEAYNAVVVDNFAFRDKFSKLSPENKANAIKYIDFLLKEEELRRDDR